MEHRIMLIVANEPGAGLEREYNDWYTGKHIPMMFAFRGLRRASRYRLSGENRECSKYLAIYEFDSKEDMQAFLGSPEYAAAVKDFEEKWKGGGFASKWGASYELMKTWEKVEISGS